MKKVLALLIALMPVLASAKITLGEVTISGEKSEVTVEMRFPADMPVRFPTVTYVWGHGDLFFCDAPFKLTFRRTKEGENFAALYIHVTAATNRFVDENFIVLLMGEEELDTFLDTFSSKNIEKVMLENADYDPNTDKRTVDDSLFK